MDTPLAAYMKAQKIDDDAFAPLISRDRSMVSKIRRGKVRPTLEVAAAIESATKGQVPMQAWAA